MTQTMPDDLWREFPKTATEFEARFATEEDCRAYWIKARWGGKPACDVSYLACASKLLGAPDAVFPQFATHKAYTVAAVHSMAGDNFYPDSTSSNASMVWASLSMKKWSVPAS